MILIALGLAVLMAFMALAVDGGNVYAQRRQVQNAVDAAAYAAAQRLAVPDPNSHTRATNGQVRTAANTYATKNGLTVDGSHPLSINYVYRAADGSNVIDSQYQIENYGGTGSPAPDTINGRPVVGVYVSHDKNFNSFFASIIGIRTMNVGAPSTGFGAPPPIVPPNSPPSITGNGTCCADNVFPIALAQTTFTDANGDGIRDVHFEESDPSYNYPIWEKKTTAAATFYYLQWTGNTNSLATNMSNPSQSGVIYTGDNIASASGDLSNSSVRTQWTNRIGQYVTVPIYDTGSPTSNPTSFHIAGFARMKIVGVCRYGNTVGSCNTTLTSTSGSYVQVKFANWSASLCEGTCPNYGIVTTTNHPPLPTPPSGGGGGQARSLIGVVKLNKLIPVGQTSETQVPIDVVHVLDISGSMNYCVGTTTDCPTNPQQKLRFAKSALVNFNNAMSPTLGDRVGLATFPRLQSGSTYNYSCTASHSYSTYYYGENRTNLTANINGLNTTVNNLSANGGTPLAGGLQVGRQMVLDSAYHNPNHSAVLVVASDGIANILINGQWTGFSGNTYSAPSCNNQAVQDAITQANAAKSDANHDGRPDIIIYSIAIGTDFNDQVLRAIASEPVDQHFYTATDANSMQGIYNSLVTKIQNESCLPPNELESFANGVTVRIRNTTTGEYLTTTTTSTGYFEFVNIPAGTYQFQTISLTISGLTYDIFTDGVGGPVLDSLPTIEVGDSSGTYEKNLSLKTDDFTCVSP